MQHPHAEEATMYTPCAFSAGRCLHAADEAVRTCRKRTSDVESDAVVEDENDEDEDEAGSNFKIAWRTTAPAKKAACQ